MPFELKKVNRGWKVVDDKGREYSRKPLSKKRATLQLRALYASYNRGEFKEIKGGYIVKHDGADHTLMYGDGFFSDVFDKVKSMARAVVNVVRRIPPIRRDYPPNVRNILSQYGNGTIVGLAVRREPIKSFINTALNWLTKGKWDMAKREANYDNMFHLGLVVDVEYMGEVKRLLLEKNEVINITTSFSQSPDIQMLIVPAPVNPPLTLNEMLTNARVAMGDNFFLYDAFKNNCQNFIYNLLSNSNLMSPEASRFILQPIGELLKNLPSYTPYVARAITDVAGIANRVIYGEGVDSCCSSCAVGKSCKSANGGRSIVNRGVRLNAVAVPLKGGSITKDEAKVLMDRLEEIEDDSMPEKKQWDIVNEVLEKLLVALPESMDIMASAETTRLRKGLPHRPKNVMMKVLEEIYGEGWYGSGVGGLKEMAGGSIASQLKLLKIPKTKYLKSIRDVGQKAGYDPKDISLANDGEHKIMVKTPTGEMRYAGRVGYGDHHIYTILESKGDVPKGTAEQKQKSYLARATKIKGDWKKDKFSPNSLAVHLLW